MLRKISFLAITFFLSFNIFANTADLQFEQNAVNQEFTQIDALEKYLQENPDATLESIRAEKPELLENVETTTETTLAPMKDMPLLGAFWWGCCLGIVGLALVYFMTDHDRDQIKKAFWGCLISTVVFGGLWGFFGNPTTWF